MTAHMATKIRIIGITGVVKRLPPGEGAAGASATNALARFQIIVSRIIEPPNLGGGSRLASLTLAGPNTYRDFVGIRWNYFQDPEMREFQLEEALVRNKGEACVCLGALVTGAA
jgi:hypothetical protein